MLRPPPLSTLFPYTTLFRSLLFPRLLRRRRRVGADRVADRVEREVAVRAEAHDLAVHDERRRRGHARSEEHTSELQSQSNLVCRLLLEKKKKETSRRLTAVN